VRITLGHEKWPTQADQTSAAAIYAALNRSVQPPDDRTYSAEVTAFSAQSPASSQCTHNFPIRARLSYHFKGILSSIIFRNSYKVFHYFSSG
jgi:hypothetical protein